MAGASAEVGTKGSLSGELRTERHAHEDQAWSSGSNSPEPGAGTMTPRTPSTVGTMHNTRSSSASPPQHAHARSADCDAPVLPQQQESLLVESEIAVPAFPIAAAWAQAGQVHGPVSGSGETELARRQRELEEKEAAMTLKEAEHERQLSALARKEKELEAKEAAMSQKEAELERQSASATPTAGVLIPAELVQASKDSQQRIKDFDAAHDMQLAQRQQGITELGNHRYSLSSRKYELEAELRDFPKRLAMVDEQYEALCETRNTETTQYWRNRHPLQDEAGAIEKQITEIIRSSVKDKASTEGTAD